MSNKTYRLRDVPKGQRLKHFITYYKLHVFFGLVLAVMAGYTIYGILKPQPDLQVMWCSGGYSLDCEFELRKNLGSLDWDMNQDGQVGVLLTYIDFDREYQQLGMDTMSELMILISGQQYSFFLAGPYARDWMEENELLGSWADLGFEGAGAEETLMVPMTKIKEFFGSHTQPLEDVCLCIRSSPEDPEKLEEYQRQGAALRRLLEGNGLLPPAG